MSTSVVFLVPGDNPHMQSIMALCQICVYANSASNPLIYNAVNEQFREGFKNYFRTWIECVLRIKANRQRDGFEMNERRGHETVGSCTMCRGSDTSLNGTLCSQGDSRLNNNVYRLCNSRNSIGNTIIASNRRNSQEHKEFLTSV